MKEILKIIFACIAIIAGIIAIISIVGNAEHIMALLSLTFGVMAIIWIVMARSSLSPGSSLRSYTCYFLACVIFILISTIWDWVVIILNISSKYSYAGYVFVSLAYILFVVTAQRMYHLGREFGFQKEATTIKGFIKEKKPAKRK